MRTRALTSGHDFTFGQGQSNYLQGKAAVAQTIQTRLLMVLGDCFFALNSGIDWFKFLGGKDLPSLLLAINSTIINTDNVTGILNTSISLDESRNLSFTYSVNTTFGVVTNTFQYDIGGVL